MGRVFVVAWDFRSAAFVIVTTTGTPQVSDELYNIRVELIQDTGRTDYSHIVEV